MSFFLFYVLTIFYIFSFSGFCYFSYYIYKLYFVVIYLNVSLILVSTPEVWPVIKLGQGYCKVNN